MDDEEKKLLYRAVKLSEDNHHMLREMLRWARIRRYLTLSYWLIIIVLTVAAYYLVEPYIKELYGGLAGVIELVQKLKPGD
ncbi:MAG: hypothetical protein HYT43_00270 [Candidatus Taylorbacteria bacterium]|nr:hypothetical protein [Candidatus Taylorbacteria bacterium]